MHKKTVASNRLNRPLVTDHWPLASPLLNLPSVKFILAAPEFPLPAGFSLPARPEAFLYLNPHALPRARWLPDTLPSSFKVGSFALLISLLTGTGLLGYASLTRRSCPTTQTPPAEE